MEKISHGFATLTFTWFLFLGWLNKPIMAQELAEQAFEESPQSFDETEPEVGAQIACKEAGSAIQLAVSITAESCAKLDEVPLAQIDNTTELPAEAAADPSPSPEEVSNSALLPIVHGLSAQSNPGVEQKATDAIDSEKLGEASLKTADAKPVGTIASVADGVQEITPEIAQHQRVDERELPDINTSQHSLPTIGEDSAIEVRQNTATRESLELKPERIAINPSNPESEPGIVFDSQAPLEIVNEVTEENNVTQADKQAIAILSTIAQPADNSPIDQDNNPSDQGGEENSDEQVVGFDWIKVPKDNQAIAISLTLPKSASDSSQESKENSPLKSDMSEEQLVELDLIPSGIKLGNQTTNEVTLIKGAEDGARAVNFDQWRIGYNDVIDALRLQVTPQEGKENIVEVRSPGSRFLLDLSELPTDPDLGLVFLVAQIEALLSVPVSFDIDDYTVVFEPPWLGQNVSLFNPNGNDGNRLNLEGLPRASSAGFTLSAISQELRLIAQNGESADLSGDLEVVGSIAGGSWYAAIDQQKFDDLRTWEIDELQYLQERPFSDVVVGTQPFFWPEGATDYVGFTTIRRFGFIPQFRASTGNGFNPSQRLSTRRVERDIRGEAEPGALVQLVSSLGNIVVDEVLVDSSGIYRFEDVVSAFSLGSGANLASNYRLFLYPRGQLTAAPEIRSVSFSSLPGQLSAGTSALIFSVGVNRNQGQNRFLGELENEPIGGFAYRWGASDSLTLGAGLFYDEQIKGSGELFWQPSNVPLRVRANAVFNSDEGRGNNSWIRHNANLDYRPTRDLTLSFDSDELSQRARVNWRISSNLSANANWNSVDEAFGFGVNSRFRLGAMNVNAGIDIDTKQDISWNFLSQYRKWTLDFQGNETGTDGSLEYGLFASSLRSARAQRSTLFLDYDTTSATGDHLALLGWRYRRSARDDKRFIKNLNFSVGYGVGSQGSGLVASLGTNIAGLNVSLGYRTISLTSDESSFSVFVSNRTTFVPGIGFTDRPVDRLRREGGLVLLPFYDRNSNGQRDNDEALFTEEIRQQDANLLFLINGRDINTFANDAVQVDGDGLFYNMQPGIYRLDLDPAGIPLGWQTNESAFALSINAGSYTTVEVPLRPAYVLAGYLLDEAGDPISGARVQAIAQDDSAKRTFSITNSAGIYYLESLDQGSYDLLVNGQPLQPGSISFDEDSEGITEVNLTYSR